jgi:DNA-binding response OmpR family regulator
MPSQKNAPHRILVVEADVFLRHFNVTMLLLSGYKADAAADGDAAWQALNTNSYDLLITGNAIPKVSGVELLKRLRTERMALPVIMATGTSQQHEFIRYPWLQPAATLLKPYTAEAMLRTVKMVLREAESATENPE